MSEDVLTKRLIAWSALTTVLAGVIHLVIIPEHWVHARAHGLFFLIVGVLQIVWGIAVWWKPSTRLYYIGVILAGWLIVLYAITRWLPAPFGHGPESIAAIDIACKLCEGLGMFTLGILIFQGIVLDAGRTAAWRGIAVILLLSVLAGFVTYGAARAAEPIFPSLSTSVEVDHRHGEGVPTPLDEHHHEEGTPASEHDH